MKILLLGADGFIGRHLAFGLRAAGAEVIASARAPARLAAMGFEVLAADLTDPATHAAAFWAPHLAGGVHVVNCAGLLTGSEAAFRAVHLAAPAAVAAARDGGHFVQISAVGIEAAETPFARHRRAAEAMLADLPEVTVLRPGLVLADTSYGGSSLMRALAAMPVARPVVGTGDQPFNPIHAGDLTQVVLDCLGTPPGFGPWEVGGPETLSQEELGALYRRWFGLRPVPVWHLPVPLAHLLGRLGEALRLGPISATAVAQLQGGVLADPSPLLARIPARPRGVSGFVMDRPAGTQDLWQARLYLLKPLIRLTLALTWLASAALGFLTPAARIFQMVPALPEPLALVLGRGGGLVDLALGLALLRNWRPRATALAQLAIVGGYTIGLSTLAPALWLDPIGGMLKNLGILALIAVHLALAEER